ncbi:hypothetical protein HWV62_45214 [Athelia sp. TMB]|nr:hypothetical protein HWV62_45214 [Athelia sp. TMB]
MEEGTRPDKQQGAVADDNANVKAQAEPAEDAGRDNRRKTSLPSISADPPRKLVLLLVIVVLVLSLARWDTYLQEIVDVDADVSRHDENDEDAEDEDDAELDYGNATLSRRVDTLDIWSTQTFDWD